MSFLGRNTKICNKPLRLGDLTEEKVYQMTRFLHSAVQELYELLKDDITHPTSTSHADTQVLAGMSFLCDGEFPMGCRQKLWDFTAISQSCDW